jgi:hypothetical protein
VENTGGSGTANVHWRESVFGNELMTGWLSGSTQPLSRITVGSLADIGYQVDMNAADQYTPPGGLMSGGGGGGGGSGGGGGGLRASSREPSVYLPVSGVGVTEVRQAEESADLSRDGSEATLSWLMGQVANRAVSVDGPSVSVLQQPAGESSSWLELFGEQLPELR